MFVLKLVEVESYSRFGPGIVDCLSTQDNFETKNDGHSKI